MRICVYGASGDRLDARYFEAAGELGTLLARGGHTLIFGGGAGGLMGAAARAAVAEGGRVIGVAPRFFDEPGVLFSCCTDFIFTETMRERKSVMEQEAEAFIALPGGIGTFEEFFEILTLKQLGRHDKPIALLNSLGYYEPVRELLQRAADGGFMSRRCFALFSLCDSPEQALDCVQTAGRITGDIRRLGDYTR